MSSKLRNKAQISDLKANKNNQQDQTPQGQNGTFTTVSDDARVARSLPPSSIPRVPLNPSNTSGKKWHAFVHETAQELDETFNLFYNPVKNLLYKKQKKGFEQFIDKDFNKVFLNVKNLVGKSGSKEILHSIIASPYTPTENPVIGFFEKYDKVYPSNPSLIDEFIDTINSDTAHGYKTLVKRWLAGFGAMLSQNINETPPRMALVLTGAQNTGKTEWFRRLLPTELRRDYYAESNLSRGKDDELLLCQNMILVNDEWDGHVTKKDPERLKTLISKNDFDLRVPYGKMNQKFKRVAMIAGTSNPPEILNDPTGNTRIIPINVISIDHDRYNAIDKKHLFVEMLRLYLSGYEYHLQPADNEVLKLISLHHTSTNVNSELLQMYFQPIQENEYQYWKNDRRKVMNRYVFDTKGFDEYNAYTATEVMMHLQNIHQKLNIDLHTLGKELTRFTTKKAGIQNNEGVKLQCGYILKKTEKYENELKNKNYQL